jgi:hypothetical protein
MQPDIVIIGAPEGQRLAGVGEAVKDLLVQALRGGSGKLNTRDKWIFRATAA